MPDINIDHHNQGMSGHLLGLAVFTLGNVDKTGTLEPRAWLAATDRRQLALAPASPGWVIGCVVTSARDITIKTSRILRMSAILNGIRNPNCPDYNAHTGLKWLVVREFDKIPRSEYFLWNSNIGNKHRICPSAGYMQIRAITGPVIELLSRRWCLVWSESGPGLMSHRVYSAHC